MTSQADTATAILTDASVLDRMTKKRGILLLRWLLIIVTCCLVLFSGRMSGYGQFLMLLLILSNVLLANVPERIFLHPRFDCVLILSDTLLVSIGIVYAGLGDSDFFLIYFAIILLASLGQSFQTILANTFVVIVLYSLVAFQTAAPGRFIDTQLYIRLPFLFAVSLFYGYIVELLNNERRMTEEILIENRKIKNIERKKTEFLGAIAHNLRTPLTTIKSYADYLVKNSLCVEEYRSFLQTISHEINRLSAVIDDFIDVSKIDLGGSECRFETLDLSEVIACSQLQFKERNDAVAKGIRIRSMLDDHLPKVRVDRKRIAQVMTNILDNAACYTPKGGEIIIEAKKLGRNEVLVSVTDNGPGIPDEWRQRIFEPYCRGGNTDIKAKRGLGLGLSISKRIIESHNGRIWVESEEGRGSTFLFSLPRG